MNRKVVLAIIITLILASFGVIVFYFLNKKPSTQTSTPLSDSVLPKGIPTPSGFGNNPTTIIGGSTSTSTEEKVVIPRLRHITTSPIAGNVLITRKIEVIENRIKINKTSYFIRYMDRATGHIYEINAEEPDIIKISNTTIPKVYEALFNPLGDSVITRTLSADKSHIVTYSIQLKNKPVKVSTSTKQTIGNEKAINENYLKDVVGNYLPEDIDSIAVSPSGNRVLSLNKDIDSGVFVVSNTQGKNASIILEHPLYEWQVSIPNESEALITTKPSGLVNGYAYMLNLSNGSLRKVIGGIAGLTIISNSNATRFVGGATPSNKIKLFVITSNNKEPKVLPISTLPEKCVWSNDNITVYCAVPVAIPSTMYPDSWYKGKVSFLDQIWKINTETEETTLISDLPEESKQAIDAINLSISSDNKYLTFTNKTDLTLWGLDLSLKEGSKNESTTPQTEQ